LDHADSATDYHVDEQEYETLRIKIKFVGPQDQASDAEAEWKDGAIQCSSHGGD
jgi:hypothetical protein